MRFLSYNRCRYKHVWSFLKKTFGKKKKSPQVKVTGFRDGLLSFRSEEFLSGEKHVTIETPTANGMLKATVDIQSYNAQSKEYLARIEGGDETLESLDVDLASLVTVARVLRVSSAMLPSYTGLTQEVSPSGLKLSTSEPLEVGDVLQLDIEFDWAKLGALRVGAEVEWSSPYQNRSYLSGLRFVDLDKGTFALLTQYVRLCR